MTLYTQTYGQDIEQASPGTDSASPLRRAPLLIVHGLFGSSDNWHGIAQKLAADRLVVTMDLPNHGRSQHFPRADYDVLSDAVLQVASDIASGAITPPGDGGPATAPAAPVVLGHSMGGKAAMVAALRQPESLAGIIVADIAPVRYPPHHKAILKGLQALAEHNVADRREGDQLLSTHVPDKMVRAFLLKNLAPADDEGYYLRLNEEAIRKDYDAISGFPELDLPAYEGPVRVIRGLKSDYVAQGLAPFAQLFPSADLADVPDAGHWLHAENPGAFLQAVEEFMHAIDTNASHTGPGTHE